MLEIKRRREALGLSQRDIAKPFRGGCIYSHQMGNRRGRAKSRPLAVLGRLTQLHH